MLFEIGKQMLGRPAGVCGSNMRIHTPTGLYTYADGLVVVGTPKFLDERRMNLVNPAVIVEVLSPDTEAYDRGRKFKHYHDSYIELESVGCRLRLRDLYYKVEFPAAETAALR